MKIRIFGVLILMLLVIPAGCGPSRDDETPEGLTALAEHALESGNPAEALNTYSRALDRYPDDPAVSVWHLGRGRALLELGRYSQAQAAAEAAHGAALDPRSKAMSLLLQARILLSTGSFENGTEKLSGLELEDLDRGDSEDAVQLIRQGLEKVSMDNLIEHQHTEGWAAVFYLLEIEKRYAYQGETEKALLTGMEIDRLYPDAHQRYGRPEIAPDEGGFVGLVLPFEGQGAAYAQRVRTGVELAFSSSSSLFSSTPQLIVFDCSGDSADITEIMTSLGANPSCLAVIGPLTSRNAELAAPIAQEWSLPMITPTATSTALDDYGGYVHRLVVSHGDEAAAVAEYAYRHSGCSRFAILHSFTSESVTGAEQFSAVIEDLGGEVVAMEGYETGATDFRDQINVIRYQYPDGVFLPVDAWDAIQIAPQLRFYRVEADLFGTSGWDDEILLQQGGEYVEGAVFPVSFGSGSMNPATARFSYFYQREYGEQPNILAAQGYDTAEIVLESWEGRRPDRSTLENRLNNLDVYFGATGMCSIGDTSIPRSAYPLVKVTDGEIISID